MPANVFFRAGEIEAWGRGIERIIEACKEAGVPEPKFDYDGTGLWTVFYYAKEVKNTTQKNNQKTTRKQPENIRNSRKNFGLYKEKSKSIS